MELMTVRTCAGCGVELPPDAFWKRKWCSDRCRKWHSYAVPCVDCGELHDGASGNSEHRAQARRCRKCAPKYVMRQKRAKRDALFAQILAMREQGYLNWAIEADLGLPGNAAANAFAQMRRMGIDVPRSPYWGPR